MKTQIVYSTNVDFEASTEKIAESNFVIWERYQKGIVWFKVKGTTTIFNLSPHGRLQVKWEDPEEKRILLKIVKNILAPKQGQELQIRPISQQAFVTYPPPEKFKLYWCDEITEYERQTLQKELYGDAFATALSSGKFVLATVGKSEIQREVCEMRLEQIERYLQNSSLSTRLVTRVKEARFFLTNLVSEFSENAQEFSVMMLQSKEGTRVQLTEEEMLNLLGKAEKRNLIRSVFNARWNLARSHPTKDNLPIADDRFGETWIVLRWKPNPRLSRKKLRTTVFAHEEKCFIEWLRQFKSLSYNKKLVDYAIGPGPRGTKDWLSATDHLSSEDKKKFSLLSEKYSEYRRKKSRYEKFYFRALF
jgi:hypothetical protein